MCVWVRVVAFARADFITLWCAAVSVELEKPKAGGPELVAVADVVFAGREFCSSHGCADAEAAVEFIARFARPGYGPGGGVACTSP